MKKVPFLIIILFGCLLYLVFTIQRLMEISKTKVEDSSHQYNVILGTGYFSSDIIESFYSGVKSETEKYDAVVNIFRPESFADTKDLKDWLEFAHYSSADGLIIFSNKDSFIADELLDTNGNQIPVVVAGSCSDSSIQNSCVSGDCEELGKKLAEFLNEHDDWNSISFAIDGEYNPSDTKKITEAVLKNIDSEKVINHAEILSSKMEDNVRKLLISSVREKNLEKKTDVIVCFSTEILNIAAQTAIDLNVSGKVQIVGFFGNGKTLEYIQKGVISAVATIDVYEMGRMCMEELFESRQSKSVGKKRKTRTLLLKGGDK